MPADPMRPAGLPGPGQQPGGLPAARGCDREREGWDPGDQDPAEGESPGQDLHFGADDQDPDAGGPPAGAVFGQGCWGDGLAPDPVLATLLDLASREGLGQLDNDQLTGVLQAANRLAAWSASLRVAAVSGLAARREADGQKSGDWRPFDHVDDEVAIALTLTRRSAGRLVDLALSLDRLPRTRAELSAGLIDERRAEVITEELSGLDDAHAAAAEELLIARAPGLTSGQLRALARRLVISADPKAARRRKEQALRDARVEAFTEHAGTAALAGRDLYPVDVLAADKHLTALAQAMKAAGISGTMDTLRAHAYLHLLSGQPASTLLDPAPWEAPPGHPTPPGPGNPPDGPATPSPAPATPGAGLGLRGTVNLTMPLPAWLGWTQSPGEAAGFGPLDATDSRTLADLLAANPASRWCVTLTSPAGHPVAHACAPHGPPPRPGPSGPRIPARPGTAPAPGTRAGPPTPPVPGTRAGPGDGPPDSDPSRDRPPGTRPPGTGPPATGPPAAATPPDWLRTLTFTTLQTRDCTHPRQSPGYQPSPALRHLIQIRNPTCTAPGCRRPATRCDLDHVTSYHRGGRTCECNLGPACRHHHQTKQTPGWTLTTTSPGTLTWTTPANRTHTTTPTQYWE